MPIEQINNTTGTVLYLDHDQAGSTRLLTVLYLHHDQAGTTAALCPNS
jgi:hypothetical protein